MAAKDVLGAHGEQLAAQLLEEQGWQILDRNWRCREGEIDIVARETGTDTIAFVEVKTRSSDRFGHPAEAVHPAKLRRLRVLAGQWLGVHGQRAATVQIDVIAILCRPGVPATLEHLRAVG